MNLVLIVSDNQSPWTLGCYGNREICTPRLDELAATGMRFDCARAVNPVCSPNRATILTGLMPSQHGVHSWLGMEKPDAQLGPNAYCTIAEFANLPRLLNDAGYRCGLSGKWHLGDCLHAQQGFDFWYCRPRGHTHSFHDSEVVRDGKLTTEPGYFPTAITDQAINFLSQAGNDPFFLYVGHNLPYGLDHDLRRPEGHVNRFTDYYAGRTLTCCPKLPPHPWQNTHCDLREHHDRTLRRYAAAVSGLDDEVGRLLDALAAGGHSDDTIVVFTADQGLCGGHHGIWGMGDHTTPRTLYEENLQVPLLWQEPQAARGVCDAPICHYDLLPTLLERLALPAPATGGPGLSFAPALDGADLGWDDRITFHEHEQARTIRTPRWKLTLRRPGGPDELYDLAADPDEQSNLVDDDDCAATLQTLTAQLVRFFAAYSVPAYDLWQAGYNKAVENRSG